jgi:tetratricopeptide (TPR) repeat protein
MRILNVRFLLVLLGLAVATTSGVAITHYLQAGRIAAALLAQARAAEDEGRPAEAARCLSRYLEFMPRDVEERAHLGELLASPELAVSPHACGRAVMVLEQVLGRDPDRRDSRRRLVRLALDTGRPELAREHLKVLCDSSSSDAEAEDLRGRLHETMGEYAEAAEWYRRAAAHAPGLVDAAAHLATLLRRHPTAGHEEEQGAEADRILDELVAKNEEDYRAHLARWRHRMTFTDLEKDAAARRQAGRDVVRARELAPDVAEVLVAGAELARAEGRTAEARAILHEAVERHPGDVAVYRGLAALEMHVADRKAAADCLRKAVKRLPARAGSEFVWSLTHLLIDGDEAERGEAAALIADTRRSAGPSASADYLQGRLLLTEHKPAEAARLFERARPELASTPDLAEQLDLALGHCYEQMGDAARQAAAYARLAGRSTRSLPALLGLAAAEASLGRLASAIAHYRAAVALPGAPPEVRANLVRLMIAHNRNRNDADWDAVEEALRDLDKARPNSPDGALLRAEALAARGKTDEARRVLESACIADTDFKHPELRLALALMTAERGEVGKARQLLDDAQARAGDTAGIRAARARLLTDRPPDEARAELTRLAEGIDQWKPDDQGRVLRALAEARARLGDLKEAQGLCVRLAALPGNENDQGLRLLLCELAGRTGDADVQRQALDDLRRIEGGAGPAWCYGEAVRLTALARRGQADGLTEARRLLDRAAAQRPAWGALVLAKADVAELQHHPEEAIAQYRQALALGEYDPRLGRRLVELLCRQQRYRDADEELRRLSRQVANTPGLQLLAADLSLRTRDTARAVRLALQEGSASNDYRDVLWRGQILAASPGHVGEAEQFLRRAVEMEPGVPETWVALVQFLAGCGRRKDAEGLLVQARTRLRPEQGPLALAPCHEALGRFDLARQEYEAALQSRPDDVAVLRAASGYYLRRLEPRLAEPLLRRIIDGTARGAADDVAWARLGLANALASHGDQTSFVEALALVGLKLDETGQCIKDRAETEDTIDRRRAQAHVLATRPGRLLRGRAVELLEELDRGEGLVAGDRFLLSQLYEAAAERAKAGEQLRRLTQAPGAEPAHLAHYAQNLLRQGKTVEAQSFVERLEAAEKERGTVPGALGSVELRARCLEAAGEGDRAVALLKAHAARPGARPEEILLPVSSLARQKRYEPALELMEAAWQSECPPEVLAGQHVGLLRAAGAAGEPCRRAELLLHTALERRDLNPRAQAAMLFARADLEDLRGDLEAAQADYRRVLDSDPNNPVALNNLAWLLAMRGGAGTDALPLIQKAIDVLGPRSDLLDTRALVYLAMGRPDRACADLKASLADTPTATRYLHLARLCRTTDDADGAAAALREARALGLRRAQLHPAEQRACASLLDGIE